ncbi:MAG: phytanoyl-CoA dioxygenase family protein [Phycisphaeraceae bacterium]
MSLPSATHQHVREALHRDGYAVIKQAVNPITAMRLSDMVYMHLNVYRGSFRAATGVDLDDAQAVSKYVAALHDGESRYAALDKDVQHLLRGEFPLVFRLGEEFRAIASQRALIAALQAVLAKVNLRMHYPPMIRFKQPGQAQANVPMHQDCSYNAHLEEFVTAWLPLCEITDACGGVDVLVGSHRDGALPHGRQVIWGNYVEEVGLQRFKRVHVTMALGDALLFGPYTLHASHANTSERPRCSIDCRFFSRLTASTKHYLDVATGRVITPALAA